VRIEQQVRHFVTSISITNSKSLTAQPILSNGLPFFQSHCGMTDHRCGQPSSALSFFFVSAFGIANAFKLASKTRSLVSGHLRTGDRDDLTRKGNRTNGIRLTLGKKCK
jgi:hypothetical protein